MAEAKIGVIGGSGLYEMEGLEDVETVSLETPFGPPSADYVVGRIGGKSVAFLARHGVGHRLLAERAQLPREHLRAQAPRGRVHPLGERGGLAARGHPSARRRAPRPVHRPHPRAASRRSSAAASRRTSSSPHPSLRAAREPDATRRRRRSAPELTEAVPTSVWRVRSSRRSPSPSSIVPGARTSSA